MLSKNLATTLRQTLISRPPLLGLTRLNQPNNTYLLQQSHNLVFYGIRIAAYSTEANVNTLIRAVEQNDSKAIIQMAKEQPHLIVQQTSNDNTALHEAAKRGDVKMINILAENFSEKFNVNHKCHCHFQRTPAHYATEGGHEAALNRLFSLGANPNITDEKGQTLLDYAINGINAGDDKKPAFERMAVTIYEHGGKASGKYAIEAQQIVNTKKTKEFVEKYKTQITPQIAAAKSSFLATLNASKQLGPGQKGKGE